jgi:hypothetical protein
MLDSYIDEIDEVVRLYRYAKTMKIEAETFGDKGRVNLSDELSKAFDHFIRAVEYEKLKETSFAKGSIGKIKCHLVRCGYDASEIYILGRLDYIVNNLKGYNVEDIKEVIPNYFSEIVPESDRIKRILAEAKINKDENVGIKDVNGFGDIVKSSKILYETVRDKINAISDLDKRRKAKEEEAKNIEKKDKKFKNWTCIFIPIASIVIGAAIGIIGWLI